METRRWLNQSQPQTLQIAVFLLYAEAAIAVITGAIGTPLGLLLIAGAVAAGYGIANERNWGYWLGIAIAALGLYPYLWLMLQGGLGLLLNGRVLLGLMVAVAKMVLLVHPMSRSYQKIWFK